jgi:hypothetical protein
MNIILLVSLASENFPFSKEMPLCARGATDVVPHRNCPSMSIK